MTSAPPSNGSPPPDDPPRQRPEGSLPRAAGGSVGAMQGALMGFFAVVGIIVVVLFVFDRL